MFDPVWPGVQEVELVYKRKNLKWPLKQPILFRSIPSTTSHQEKLVREDTEAGAPEVCQVDQEAKREK
jgi:hypothetical protein